MISNSDLVITYNEKIIFLSVNITHPINYMLSSVCIDSYCR